MHRRIFPFFSLSFSPSLQGFMIPLVKVYSMVAVQTSHVLLGTDSGHILVYDGYSRKRSHQLSPLHDPVLCLQFFRYVSVRSHGLIH